MASPEITIWVQPLGAGWTPLGADLGVEVIPESVTYERARQGGPSSAAFSLRRVAATAWGDLGPFTPVYIELAGVPVWRGRIVRTPKQRGSENIWNVECEGMYAHLSDDVTNVGYVHDGSAGWIDAKTWSTNSSTFIGPGEVSNNQFGRLVINVPVGSTATVNDRVGHLFDAGPGNTIETVYLDWDSSASGANYEIWVRGSDNGGVTTGEATNIDTLATASGTDTVTFVTPRRYVMIYLFRAAGAGTLAANAWLRINEVRLYASDAYNSSGASILKQSDVIMSDLSRMCPLISSDQSLITASSTSIPHYYPDGYQTVRERIESLTMFDGMQFTLTPEPTPRAKLSNIPTTPTWVYDAATDGGTFEDGGANDGQEMYSKAIVTYKNANGVPIAGSYTPESGTISLSNGTFDVDAANWTAGSGTTIARDTARSWAGAGSLKLTATGSPSTVSAYTEAFSTGLIPGRTYTVTAYVRYTQAPEQDIYAPLQIQPAGGGTPLAYGDVAQSRTTSKWQVVTATFTATTSTARIVYEVARKSSAFANSEVGHIDEVTIELAPNTLIDRRGFTRSVELSSESSSSTAAAALADTLLDTAQYPPFKGSVTLTGYVRKYNTDEYIPVGQIPDGDALLIVDEPNLTTGAVGRMGIVERVAYEHDTLTAQIDLDSREDILDQLVLARRGLA